MPRAKRAAAPSRRKAPKTVERRAMSFSIADSPGYLFRQLQLRGSACFVAAVGADGFTPQQFIVLLTLVQRGSMSLTDLASRISMDRSTLGEMVQRLVERSLVARTPAKKDRRSVEVEITDAGKEAVLAVLPLVEKAQNRMLEPLAEEYRPLFLKCLRILADAPLPQLSGSGRLD